MVPRAAGHANTMNWLRKRDGKGFVPFEVRSMRVRGRWRVEFGLVRFGLVEMVWLSEGKGGGWVTGPHPDPHPDPNPDPNPGTGERGGHTLVTVSTAVMSARHLYWNCWWSRRIRATARMYCGQGSRWRRGGGCGRESRNRG